LGTQCSRDGRSAEAKRCVAHGGRRRAVNEVIATEARRHDDWRRMQVLCRTTLQSKLAGRHMGTKPVPRCCWKGCRHGGLPYDAAPYLTPLACLYVDATILYSHPRFIVTLSFLGILLKIRLKPLPIDGAASRCWCQRLRQASTSPLASMSSRRRLALPPASPDRGSHAAKPRSKSRHPASMPAFFFVIVFSLQFRTTGVRTKNASLHVVHGHPCPVPSISVRRIATSG